ncbi:apolipoprotein A1/A4/E family protein [Acidianus sp. HS-5]|uniref:apolipoprotein A1/A4/E family protein n=1 Tax=Acidianus sp. HS-5 TaxID=2886040 RepID=UPI001F3C7465|nr:apolipoprotein A1/A4/E family protein [Acidianus sp. HS-5]BDC18730.1 hypothetical protein HS5_16200 [Acidianus sp. HS-5]
MEDVIRKWFDDYLLRIAEKIKSGQELTNSEILIVLSYITGATQGGLKKEIRKTKEELIASDEKLRNELTGYIDKTRKELLENDDKLKKELIEYIDKTKKELLESDDKVKKELIDYVDKTKAELLTNDERIKNELISYVNKVKEELLANDEKIKNELLTSNEKVKHELITRIEAYRSDQGLIAEELYINSFKGSLKDSGEKIVNIYRHYETSAGEVDALVETEKRVYVVEVKLKAEEKDVDELLNKVKEVEKEFQGKEIVPVLTGAKIGKNVRGYAKGMGVKVF